MHRGNYMSSSGDEQARDAGRESEERRRSGHSERRRAGNLERERALRLQLIADVGRRTTAILSPAELLRSSVQIIQEKFHYFMVNIFLVDGEEIVLRASSMEEFRRRINTLRMVIGREGINGWVAKSGVPLNVPDVRKDRRYRFELAIERQIRSELAVPIIFKGAVIGVLDVQSEMDAAFNELDVFTLQTVADQLAVAIENARLYEELQRELAVRKRTERLLRALHVAGVAMEKASSPEEIFVTVAEELDKVGLLCAVHLASADRREVTLAHASPSLSPDESPPGPTPLADNKVFEAILQGAHAVFEPGGIVAPLLFEDRLLGFLTVLSPEIGIDDIPTVQVFANEIAAAWRKAQLVGELRRSLQDLERTQEQLGQSQKMEAVGRLAGGVAHDFNNQLTAIMGYADLLISSLGEDDARRLEVAEITRAAGRAAELTRQLLAFSRRQVLRPRVVDLNDLVREMGGMLQRLIGENIRLKMLFGRGPFFVRADPAQLERVVMNLVVNARDAMPNGGTLQVATSTEPGADRQSAGATHVLSVTDTGTGMSPEVLSRLFEPFFTTKEPGHGTGLGLSTAYGIVQQSGGRIAVRSTVGQGTTFVISLPATREAPEAARAPDGAFAAGKEEILVVEDEAQVRELVRRILANAGYSVLTEPSGEGLSELLRSHPDVRMVITDLVLAGNVSGTDIARSVLAHPRGVRVLCISGYSEQLVSGDSSLLASVPFLQKPFSAPQLLQKVRAILDAPGPGAATANTAAAPAPPATTAAPSAPADNA
jgi:signal transduction histidine kinase/CheY-like chemotaxis protein/putative methionine-R-sulfoxide reductase with GAF domain